MSANDIPKHLKHTPIYAVDYEQIDESGDAKFLSIGHAQWNKNDFSVKIFRKVLTDEEKWSRQSEELPFWRVFDLAIMICSVIKNNDGGNGTSCETPKCVSNGKEKSACVKYLTSKDSLHKRMKELKDLLNSIDL